MKYLIKKKKVSKSNINRTNERNKEVKRPFCH